jgi:hypothetical protein
MTYLIHHVQGLGYLEAYVQSSTELSTWLLLAMLCRHGDLVFSQAAPSTVPRKHSNVFNRLSQVYSFGLADYLEAVMFSSYQRVAVVMYCLAMVFVAGQLWCTLHASPAG